MFSTVRFYQGLPPLHHSAVEDDIVKFNILSRKTKKLKPDNEALLCNAHEPLVIQTYDGSNQVVHPCVIDFLTEHGYPEWRGHRFWMVITPYPNSDDTFENPSMFVSDDGFNWFVPSGITNPLDHAPGGLKNGFNSDPDMVYDPELDELRIYYRFASASELKLKMIVISKDLVMGPTTVMSKSPWNYSDNTYRSLCIWRESSARWHMWGGGGTERPPFFIYYRFSKDGILWDSPRQCMNDEGQDPFEAIGYTNWHMSCKPNHREKRVEFLSCAYPLSSIGRGVILYAECGMSTPTIIRTPISKPVLTPSENGWDNMTLYRCTFSASDTESNHYRIWYSAMSRKEAWKVGYAVGYINNDRGP